MYCSIRKLYLDILDLSTIGFGVGDDVEEVSKCDCFCFVGFGGLGIELFKRSSFLYCFTDINFLLYICNMSLSPLFYIYFSFYHQNSF